MPIETVIRLEDYDHAIEELTRRHFRAMQHLLAAGLPITDGFEHLDVTATILVHNGLNAAQQNTVEEHAGPQVRESATPEIVSTSKTKRTGKNITEGSQTDVADDKVDSNGADESNESNTDIAENHSVTQDEDSSTTEQVHATADDITISTFA